MLIQRRIGESTFIAASYRFSDQLLAEDDETVNKKFAGLFFFAACAIGSGHQGCWMIYLRCSR